MTNRPFRQGDILIRPIEKIPLRRHALAEEADEPRRLVLAHGEATGHAHVIEARPSQARIRHRDARQATRRDEGSPARHFLEVLDPAGVDLIHDEHATILIPPGEYEITRQREYDPEQARREARVRD